MRGLSSLLGRTSTTPLARLSRCAVLGACVVATGTAHAAPDDAPPPPEASTEREDSPGDSVARATFGWVALGVGGAGLVVGAIMASTAAAKYGDLDCPGDVCPPELADAAASYNDLRVPSGALLITGAAVALAGLPFLIIGTGELAEARLEIGPGSLGLRGRF